MIRDFSKVKRIVIKVGTNLLSSKDGIDRKMVSKIVDQVVAIKEKGYQPIIVSSGAIGLGAKAMKHNSPVVYLPLRQAFASIGQPILMEAWQEEFKKHNLLASQVLITRSVLNNRKSFKNLRTSVSTLLALGVVPIFNENDVVSLSEIGNVFGDNDRLSALVASKIDADLLILLTDIDGIYTANPKEDKNAKLVKELTEINSEVLSWAKGKGSTFSTGGMKTKLFAAQIARQGGCSTVIASGFLPNIVIDIIEGKDVGSYISPEKRLSQRERWVLNTPAEGRIIVDEGCKKALLVDHKSLLPSGIIKIVGVFDAGEVVEIADQENKVFMKASPYFNSTELSSIMGKRTFDIEKILGSGHKEVIFRPEDTVII